MPVIFLETIIAAPIAICFDVARDIDVHQLSTAQTREKAIAGRTSGLCETGDTITWQATHFGVRQKLTTLIPVMQPPFYFEDVMLKGAFKHMKHLHHFAAQPDGSTRMSDELIFAAPLGFIGRLAEKLFLTAYMARFIDQRNQVIKSIAESRALKPV